ncbi:hypothetical protein HU200_029432 [Digitaria exilis]|uniref:ZF-HD dimerization-type domain-containing protein n=1 Tax=Digitaria exilis TaxID=1010633 RepID=A0A835BQY6_9POAL|nr:hypothetical protein HU200_029432 [Digitaria exilis]CAB3489542.1 unnamed protein product [Digitaria exilis]
MDLSGTQGELAIPMHAYAGGSTAAAGHVLQLHHHHEHRNSNNNGQSSSPALRPPSPPPPAVVSAEDQEMVESSTKTTKRVGAVVVAGGGAAAAAVKYRECLKNHAAAIGGNATDGCGEFMPSGEEGSLEALKCSACGCHRNFHRKDLDDADDVDIYSSPAAAGDPFARRHRRLLAPAAMAPPHHSKIGGGGLLVSSGDPYGVGAYKAAARALPPAGAPPGHPHQYVMPLSMMQQHHHHQVHHHTHTSESDEMDGGGGGVGGSSSSGKKRFRTKFTAEQKARMLEFAERVGWRLQKLDDGMVAAFCQEIGVKRRVLKVWMHNNKHNLATTKRLEEGAAMASPPDMAMGVGAAAMASSPPPPQPAPMMPLQMIPSAGVMAPPPPTMNRGGGSPPSLKLE